MILSLDSPTVKIRGSFVWARGGLSSADLTKQPSTPTRTAVCPDASSRATVSAPAPVGAVGLTEDEARARGLSVQVGRLPLKHLPRAAVRGPQVGTPSVARSIHLVVLAEPRVQGVADRTSGGRGGTAGARSR